MCGLRKEFICFPQNHFEAFHSIGQYVKLVFSNIHIYIYVYIALKILKAPSMLQANVSHIQTSLCDTLGFAVDCDVLNATLNKDRMRGGGGNIIFRSLFLSKLEEMRMGNYLNVVSGLARFTARSSCEDGEMSNFLIHGSSYEINNYEAGL